MIAYCLNKGSRIEHWATGADNQGGVTTSEDPSSALTFPDAGTASAWASGKTLPAGMAQVTVSGLKIKNTKSNNN